MKKVTQRIQQTRELAIRQKSFFSTYLKSSFEKTADITLFVTRFFKELFTRRFEFSEFLTQSYKIGYKSLGLVAITGFIMGLVLTLQSRPTLAKFGAESWLPSMVALSLIKEIGPVITALICAGKIGSGIGAELGSMKVTEQIDAMEVSGINPFNYLVITRVMACTFTIPLLVIFADAIGLTGAYIGTNIRGDVSFLLFFSQAISSVKFMDFFPSLIKSVLFGFIIGIVGCYKGYKVSSGTESVGKAATSGVVTSSLAIFVIDMIIVQITDIIS